MEQPEAEVAVIMVPFAAQGHLNQLLQLSCLVSSSYKIPVYYVTSPIFIRQAKSRINGLNPLDVGNVFDGKVRQLELPEGFEERVEGIGMVERDWAPQPQILAHPSTGGFLSHCGWNSCVESISMGVPIAAWPMHSDQPANTVLVTDILKMGLVVRDWEQRMELVRASSVVSVVRRLMASDEGNGIRKRAEEVRDIVRRATQHGGVSRAEMDSFVAHISR
ncbi:zeatin o-xylosyltransferase [Phtheirospermum japonicum]|uniref:Zeatin o-xylosyltransferase n=1 Tax=Phtheirospermum japonicum TaxID=374723 RepID=A0A830BA09_9LAMI|nr:zeatin o-xylosyltransferase [Phtheirospermum japonicum]